MHEKSQIDRSVLLFPMNDGRAGHFYHYMLGYLMPIVISPHRHAGRVSVVSVGLLDRITHEVLADDVNIIQEPDITKTGYPNLRNRISKFFGNSAFRPFATRTIVKWALSLALRTYKLDRLLVLDSFDDPLLYQRDRISVFRDFVEKRLAGKIKALKMPKDKPDVVLIERGQPHGYYAEVGRTSGGQRRSIPNIDSLHERLKTHHKTEIFNLEDQDLAMQIAVFRDAKVVIAQHGAALTNIIWMRPGSLVIEIVPPDKVPEKSGQEFFSRLAREMNIRHQYIFQEHEHAELTQSQMHQIEAVLVQEID
ncbi:glycosyltransferase 61 family protein [Anderseniella sp. Alg231-50]|uniref:glycosyltransferase 61 family protein n=1 Tax=Anderseniella sp. Alg231-50 TaxID=1922226 RepID=UPI000D562C2C